MRIHPQKLDRNKSSSRVGTRAGLAVSAALIFLLAALSAGAAMQEDQPYPPPPPRDGRPHHPPPGKPGTAELGPAPRGPLGDRPDRPGPRPRDRVGMGEADGRAPMPLFARLTPREKLEMETFMREHFPRLFEQVERTRETNPQRYLRMMTRLTPEMQGLMDLMAIDPERGALLIEERRLDAEIRMVARRARSTTDDQGAKSKERLAELVTRWFDARHQRHELEIRDLEARVLELKGRHEEATRMRQKTIDRMIEERLEPPDPLEWDEE